MIKSNSEPPVKPSRRRFNLNIRLTVDPDRVYDNMGASFGGQGDQSNNNEPVNTLEEKKTFQKPTINVGVLDMSDGAQTSTSIGVFSPN